MRYNSHALPYFIVLSLLAMMHCSRSEEGQFTEVRITDLGFSFLVPNDWFEFDSANSQKLDKVLDLVIGREEKPKTLVMLRNQLDVHSTTSSSLTVLFQPETSISQQQLAKSPQSALDVLCDEIKDNASSSMKKVAVSSRITKERLVKRTRDTIFLGVELTVKMRADMPEKRKEVYYMFSSKGIIQFSFTYLASNAVKMSEMRDKVLASFRPIGQ